MKVCDHWREPCGYCPTCQCVTGERFIKVPVVDPDGSFTHMRAPASSMAFSTSYDCSLPEVDDLDAAVAREREIQSDYIVDVHERDKLLAEERRKHAEAQAEYHAKCEPVVDSLFKFAERRHKAREEAIKQGKLADVLRSDAALEGSVSNAEDIVESMLLKGGVDEPIAQLTRTVVSNLGRMFLGMGPSHRDIIETSRKLYGDERTPEQKPADRERLMAAAEKLKVKLAKQQVKGQTLGDLLESGRMCGGIDKAEGVDL